MPRHRIERQPRHRAQSPARERRRARFPAVNARPPGHARPGSGPGISIPWRAIAGTAADRLIALAARMLPYQKRVLSGAARRLVVSPWFAAGAGIVVATGAFMYAPHAQISFGNPLIGRSPCTAARCSQAKPLGGPPPVPAGGGDGLVTPSPTPSPSPSHPTTALAYKYSVTWRSNDTFQMVLTVTSKKAIGGWQLSFVIPGATNVNVVNGYWRPSGPDGGTASGPTVASSEAPGERSPSPSASASPTVGAYPDGGDAQPGIVNVVVTGDGTPSAPQHCFFNGSACAFTQGTSP